MEQANKLQSEFWNGETARSWIDLDDIQGRSFANVTRMLMDAAGIAPHHVVLDIGCGTGDSALPIARETGAQVVGVDISSVMLGRAAQRLENEPDANVSYFLGDAQTHAFETGAFDRIVSRFGMMFFEDPVAAFKNLGRALKPEGAMHFICWGMPKMNPWFAMPRRVAEEHFGELAPSVPRTPGPFGFAEKDHVLDMMNEAGLKNAKVDVVNVDLTPGDTVDEVSILANLGPIAGAMREKDGSPSDRRQMLGAFKAGLDEFVTPDGVIIPSQLNLFSAVK